VSSHHALKGYLGSLMCPIISAPYVLLHPLLQCDSTYHPHLVSLHHLHNILCTASTFSFHRTIPSRKTHDTHDTLARNRLANVSFFVCSIGELVVLGILAGILQAIIDPNDPQSNTRALSVVCAYSAGVWSEWVSPEHGVR
jgi:hypothetical protein